MTTIKRLLLTAALLGLALPAWAQGTATGIGYWTGVTAPVFGSVTVADTGCIGWADAQFCHTAANRIDLATGDSLYLVSGGLGVGVAPPVAGSLSLSGSIATSSISTSGAGVAVTGAGSYYLGNSIAISGTAPTIASGFGTSPTVPNSNGTAAFTINVGTGGTASAGVITMPAVATGWICHPENTTGVAANRANQRTVQTASTTTSITVQNQTVSTGAALAWTASDVLRVLCLGY